MERRRLGDGDTLSLDLGQSWDTWGWLLGELLPHLGTGKPGRDGDTVDHMGLDLLAEEGHQREFRIVDGWK